MSEANVWMSRALELAKHARHCNEVPVGAIVVLNGEIIGEGWNQPIKQQDPTAHAEIIALREAAQRIKNYRLLNAEMYVTLEPCPMCAGAMVHARIKRLTYGADDPRTGSAGSVFQIVQSNNLNHRLEIHKGVLAEPCSELLRDFFQERRK